MLGTNLSRVQEHNRALVYRTIREAGRIARKELADLTGLTQATMTNIVRELLEQGLVAESGTGETPRGRPMVKLAINADSRWVLGLQISRPAIRAGVFNLNGQAVAEREEPVGSFRQAARVLALARRTLEAVIAESGVERRRISGLGVATPGPVDFRQGLLNLTADGPEWEALPVRSYLEDALGLPAILDTNENASAVAEHWFGAARGIPTFACITAGAGVGAGLMLEGQLLRGAVDAAGQLGHVSVDPRGRLCRCGNRGCVEWQASVRPLLRAAAASARRPGGEALRAVLQKHPGDLMGGFFAAAAAGEPVASELAYKAGSALGAALVNLINLFNPPLVVLGGVMLRAGDPWLEAVRRTTLSRLPERVREATRIVPGGLGQDAVVVGAAALAIERLFSAPMESGVTL